MVSPEQLWADKYAARFAEERAAEEARREESFLDLPKTVCGEEVRQITPADLLVLHGVGNAFVCGGEPDAGHIGVFVWWLSVQNDGSESWANTRRKNRLMRRLRRYDFDEAVFEIQAYVLGCFLDAPGGGNQDGFRPIGTCFLAPLVTSVAVETGWSQKEILQTPLARLFQYLKAIRARKMGKEFVDSAPSDRITSEFLSELNQQLNARN